MTGQDPDAGPPSERVRAARHVLRELDGDPQAAARLRSHYRGRHEVLNALWWRMHPLEPSPRGQVDPATARRELALEVFSRAAQPGLETELLRLDELLERDERDLDDAIRRFHVESEQQSRAEAEAAGAEAAACAGRSGADPQGEQELEASVWRMAEGGGAPRQTRWLVVAAGLLVLAVATTSFALGGRLATSDRSVSPSDSVLGERDDPLARFDREQTEDDRPSAMLPFDYLEESTRRLLPGDLVGLSADYVIFGARTTDDLVCLVLAFPDDRIASTCVSVEELRSDGVRVSSNVYRQSRASLGSQTLVNHTVHWRPDDTFEFSSGSADR